MGKRPLTGKQKLKLWKRRIGVTDNGHYDIQLGRMIKDRNPSILDAQPRYQKLGHDRLREDLLRYAQSLRDWRPGPPEERFRVHTPFLGSPKPRKPRQ